MLRFLLGLVTILLLHGVAGATEPAPVENAPLEFRSKPLPSEKCDTKNSLELIIGEGAKITGPVELNGYIGPDAAPYLHVIKVPSGTTITGPTIFCTKVREVP